MCASTFESIVEAVDLDFEARLAAVDSVVDSEDSVSAVDYVSEAASYLVSSAVELVSLNPAAGFHSID